MSRERLERVNKVLAQRQPDLTVLLDGVHKAHNVAAIVRSCEAVGVLEVHRVKHCEDFSTPHGTSGGSQKWIQQHYYADVQTPIRNLQASGFQVLAANRTENAMDFRAVDFTRPTALLMGAELFGVSDNSLMLVDHEIYIPMMGMVESFNVSVACAILLAEAQRQRLLAGHYNHCKLGSDAITRMRFEWLHPKVAELCQRHGKPYPALDAEGDLINSIA